MESEAPVPPPNIFANDGSFFDQFRKKIAHQSKSSDAAPVSLNPNCQKQRPGFRPKTACKPINLKASLKKQLNSKNFLPVKGTLESKASPVLEEAEVATQPKEVSSWYDAEVTKDAAGKIGKREVSSSEPNSNSTSPTEGTRKRKKKSRWGEKPAEVATTTTPIVTVINGVPIVVPPSESISTDVTAKALASLIKKEKKDGNKYEYDSDEEVDEEGTWEHKQRAAEIQNTLSTAESLTAAAEGKHHLGDFLPSEELERFMMRATAIKKGGAVPALPGPSSEHITADNVGYRMLKQAGWKEGTGLGAAGTGIVNPIDRGSVKPGNLGLGAVKPDEPLPGDDEFDVYRKRMMLAYKYRPNPMKNPRRAYY